MPKQVIVIMQDNYPFGQCQECTNENTRVLVRKIYHLNTPDRSRLLDRVNVLRKLRNEHMIKIESVLQEEQSIHFLFQYIPIKLETWISNINDQFIENFRDQLIKFSSFLANNYIKIEFQLKNIGMDQNYGAKYFLDLDFEIDTGVNRQKLKSNYIREITNLFRPYIMNATAPVQDQRERYSNEFKGREGKNTDRKVPDSSISPPTNKVNNSKNKEKALAQYYQEVNMSVDSQNEKILQEFMDVLDNEEEEEVKMHVPGKGTQQHQSSPQQQNNQFQKQQQQQAQPQQSSPVQLKNSIQEYQQKNAYQQNSSNKQNNYPQNNNNNNYQQYQPQPQQPHQPKYQQYQPPFNQFSSAQQLPNNQFQSNPFPQFHTQNNINQSTKNNNSQSVIRNKNDMKESAQNEKWRESADLQNRVKNAIEKSMNVIKKFKAIKDETLI